MLAGEVDKTWCFFFLFWSAKKTNTQKMADKIDDPHHCPGCVAAAAAAGEALKLALHDEEVSVTGGETTDDDASHKTSPQKRKARHHQHGSRDAFMASDMRLFNPQNFCHLRRRCSGFISDELIRKLP